MTTSSAGPTISRPTIASPGACTCAGLPVLEPPSRHISDERLADQWEQVTAQVARIQRHIDRRLTQAGISAQWFAVLRLLLRAGDQQTSMSALARAMSMTSGGFTKLADRMAQDGLIARHGSPADRRIIHVTLTAAGLSRAQQTAHTYQQALRECLLNTGVTTDNACGQELTGRQARQAAAP